MTPFQVRTIPYQLALPWILDRHYAHRMPGNTNYIYGLFMAGELQGVCLLGIPPNRHFNNGYALFGDALQVPTIELTRLVIGDDLPKNTLSRFVSMVLDLLPRPMAIVSYADPGHGHHGYIYQATNWLYTGVGGQRRRFHAQGRDFHPRTVSGMFGSQRAEDLPDWLEVGTMEPKHRYVMFLGTKTERRRMRAALTYEVLPYPKGENRRYATPDVGGQLVMDLGGDQNDPNPPTATKRPLEPKVSRAVAPLTTPETIQTTMDLL